MTDTGMRYLGKDAAERERWRLRGRVDGMADGRRVGYLSLSDSLVVGPEIDAGRSIDAQLMSIRAYDDGGRATLAVTLREQAQPR